MRVSNGFRGGDQAARSRRLLALGGPAAPQYVFPFSYPSPALLKVATFVVARCIIADKPPKLNLGAQLTASIGLKDIGEPTQFFYFNGDFILWFQPNL